MTEHVTEDQRTAARALAKCAAYDPWFPQPNRATRDAWAEQIAEYKLGEADVLEGVRLAYRDNGAGFRPLPKDIVQAARQVRRERAEKEKTSVRQAREDRLDAELANKQRMAALTAGLAERKAIDHA